MAESKTLLDQVFIVTGGAGAVAGPVASAFTNAGARVVLADLTEDRLREQAAALSCDFQVADLTNQDVADDMVRAVVEQHGRLDGVIAVAGGFDYAFVADTNLDQFDRLININLRTTFVTVRAVLPVLQKQGHGFVAGFSAGPGFTRGASGMAIYSAAKSGVASFLQALDEEVHGDGVRVSIIYPMGVVDTPANRVVMPDEDPSRWISPEALGHVVVFSAAQSRGARLLELPVYPPAG